MLKNTASLGIYLTEEIRQIETLAAASNLMEKAGLAAAEIARDEFGEYGKSVLVLAGPGNNGGDAFVVARHLKSWWFDVTVLFYGQPDSLPHDAANAHREWQNVKGKTVNYVPENFSCDWIVDGLFGIGFQRELAGYYLDLVAQINALQKPVLALDIPSGLHSETGQVIGNAIHATQTVTFIGLKPGLLTLDGPDYCGDIHICDLDINPESLLPAKGSVIHHNHFQKILKPRKLNSHKGLYGNIGIIGGADSMVGAAILAARAALKLGAGRVYTGVLSRNFFGFALVQPELMFRSAGEVISLPLDSLVVGPGLGQSLNTIDLMENVLKVEIPLVLDADALNLIAKHTKLQGLLRERKSATVLTPHPTEAARLLNQSTDQIQNNRLQSALTLAKNFNSIVVLKGAGSICATPDQRWFINTTGNPGMASAGMGDVLSGMLGTLIAQPFPHEESVLLAVHLHGAAADECVTNKRGPVGLTASEITDSARDLLNQWIYNSKEKNGTD